MIGFVFQLFIVLANASGTNEPSDGMLIQGAVKDSYSAKRIIDFNATAVNADNASIIIKGVIDERGMYVIKVTEPGRYLVTISADHYFPKTSFLDLTGSTREEWRSGFNLRIDAALIPFQQIEPIGTFTSPVAFLHFDPIEREFIWDYEYIGLHQKCQRDALRAHGGLEKNGPKN